MQALLLRLLLRLRAQASKLSRRVRLWAKAASGDRRDIPGGKAKRHGFTSVAFCHLSAVFYSGIHSMPKGLSIARRVIFILFEKLAHHFDLPRAFEWRQALPYAAPIRFVDEARVADHQHAAIGLSANQTASALL
jgi:hypothetical protein